MRITERLRQTLGNIPLEPFHPASLDLLHHYNSRMLARDISAGLTVGMVAMPLAMAFAIASGVTPEAGLYTSIIAGFLIAILGGCRVQIGGPAGAFIVIIYGIIADYGLANLMIATIGSGILLFLMGLLKIGNFIRFIPVSIVIGFTNGIAVLIALSQVKDFFGLRIENMPADFFGQMNAIATHIGTVNYYALAIAAISFVVIKLWPKDLSSRTAQWKRWIAKIPGTVIVLIFSTLAVSAFDLPVETIGSKFGGIPQALPDLQMPDFDWAHLRNLMGPMITIALLGAIESLLCARVADTLTDDRHNPNQELMGQGIANIVVPFFGGIPATGTIARTVTNIKSGAVSPVAGVVHAVTLLVVVLAAAPLASNIPLAALSAILLFVASNMGNWAEFKRLRRMTMSYKVTLLLTFFLTVIFDLTVAVEVGLVTSCVFFLYRMNTLTKVTPITLSHDTPAGIEAWNLQGSLFFGSVSKLSYVTDPKRITAHNANKVIIFDFTHLMNIDNSAMDIISTYIRALKRRHFELIICGATDHTLRQLQRTGIAQALGNNMANDLFEAESLARKLLKNIP
ncbi:MAG TPA: STAS domain-containing protein [Candidatus Aphodousia gallistercoris]|nr:STAS domain-containing protein [Candidatus Aphodousia gallistercoris]